MLGLLTHSSNSTRCIKLTLVEVVLLASVSRAAGARARLLVAATAELGSETRKLIHIDRVVMGLRGTESGWKLQKINRPGKPAL